MKKENETITIFEISPAFTIVVIALLTVLFCFCLLGLSKDNEEFIKQCTSKGYSMDHCERVAYE